MSNTSRAKGTAAESAVVRWARAHGFGAADRQPLRGGRDQGDITLCPGIIVEVKAHRAPTSGVPTAGQLTDWMAQTETERANARADVGILIVKRSGTRDVGRWWAYVTAWTLADLISPASTSTAIIDGPLDAPVCLTVADLTGLLRAAGWGDALDSDVEAG